MATVSAKTFTCGSCGLVFSRKHDRESHKRTAHPRCHLCRNRFKGLQDLHEHQAGKQHCYCQACNVHFDNVGAHVLHVRALEHFLQCSCCDCGRDYPTAECLDRHCCKCDQIYKNRKRLQRHFRTSGHKPKLQIARVQNDQAIAQQMCEKCSEVFATKKALTRHQRTHKAPRVIPCPTGGSCQKKFAAPSGLLSHLESGKCGSGMTRTKVNAMVISNDIEGHIVDRGATKCVSDQSHFTDGSPALGLSPWEDAGSSASEWSFAGSATILTPTTSEASDEERVLAHDDEYGDVDDATLVTTEWEMSKTRSCPLCPHRRPFGTAAALEMHLNSAAHAPRVFHCPLLLAQDLPAGTTAIKIKSFSTLSGLAQHLESGACQGGQAAFRRVFEFVEERLAALGLRDVKLLVD